MKFLNKVSFFVFGVALLWQATPLFGGPKVNPKMNFFTFIQANNSLGYVDPYLGYSYDEYNLLDMATIGSGNGLTVLAQREPLDASGSERYEISSNTVNLVQSLNYLMGSAPKATLIDGASWASTNYQSDRSTLVLWNHGNGSLDYVNTRGKASKFKNAHPFIKLPGMSEEEADNRGILYDDATNTFLDIKDLGAACAQIKTNMGKPIDILGTDACLMAMLEIAYELQNSVQYLVGSEETIPGLGWPYSSILNTIKTNPAMTTVDFAKSIVLSYATFYANPSNPYRTTDYTLSVIESSKMPSVVASFSAMLSAITSMQSVNRSAVKQAMRAARRIVTSFTAYDYVDLVDLCDCMKKSFQSLASGNSITAQKAKNVLTSITALRTAVVKAIPLSKAGSAFKGKAYGMSIYFPLNYQIDNSYKDCSFAQTSAGINWMALIKSLGN